MQSRYEFLRNDPNACRWLAAFRAGAGVALVAVLTVAAFTAPPGRPGDTVAVELSPATGLDDAVYDGPEAAYVLPVQRDEFSNFDQLYPHAYTGAPGVMG